MKIVRFHRKAVVIGVIGFLVVIVGAAAAIGAVRSSRVADEGGGYAATAPALGDEAGMGRDAGELEKSVDGVAQAEAEGGAGNVNAALPPLTAGAQYLVRSGQLTIVVKKGTLHQAVAQITTVTRAFEGYVLSSMVGAWSPGDAEPLPLEGGDAPVVSDDTTTGQASADPYAYVTVRIPADRFDDALVRLQKLGKVRELSTSTDDVTAQIVDLRARLRHYRAVEERLLSFLDKADTVAAALAVQDRIDRTQLMVEEIEAQIKQLDETVTYSTLSISLSEKGSAPAAADDDSQSFWGAITHSLRLVGDGFRWIAVALGAALPFLVVFGILGIAVFYAARRVSRRRHDGRPGPPAPVTGAAPSAMGGSDNH